MRLGMLLFIIALGGWSAFSTGAHAWLNVCNASEARINLAIAHHDGEDWVSRGWWIIEPDDCTALIAPRLPRGYYYYHAYKSFENYLWQGEYYFCADPEAPFRISGDELCGTRGYRSLGFRQILVEDGDFTLNLE